MPMQCSMAASQLLSGAQSSVRCHRAFQSQPAKPARGSMLATQRVLQFTVRASREDDLAELANIKGSVANALKDKEAALKGGGSSPSSGATAGDLGGGAGDYADLRELTKDDFHSCLEEAGDQLVVIDFFTDWCGPCKVMYPMLCKMADEQKNVTFVKLNCNKYNKELGKQLGVRVAPTFQLYKKSEKVAEMTGAKIEELQKLIDEHK